MMDVVVRIFILWRLFKCFRGQPPPNLLAYNSTIIPTCKPTILPTSSCSPSTIKPSMTPTSAPTQPSNAPTSIPTLAPSTRKPTYIPSTFKPSAIPSTCRPSAIPTHIPTQPSATPTYRPTIIPTTLKPTFIPTTSKPSAIPTTLIPSAIPTRLPTQPSATPTYRPTMIPTTLKPTFIPTTSKPSAIPTRLPTQPSATPTYRPTMIPTTWRPTFIPTTSKPSYIPTYRPTMIPTTWSPTFIPTTLKPSYIPTYRPTAGPTTVPTAPTKAPSDNPSRIPTFRPSSHPTAAPTGEANCPGGTYINRFPTFYNCSLCNVGYYSNANYTSCQACPLNFYSDRSGSSKCLPCPFGSVTGVVATSSSAGCVNPTTNFVLGLLSLCAGAIMVILYTIFGRIPMIAFERRLWMVEKCVDMCSIACNIITKTHHVCSIIAMAFAKERQAREEDILKHGGFSLEYWWIIFKRILKPLVFVLVVILVAILVIAGTLISATYHVLFNALLLFRGYKIYFGLNFVFLDRISDFISLIGIALKLDFVVNYISYPLLYVLNVLSNLNIDLSQLKVTCSGSQAPVYLFLDCILVAILILTIVSDVHIFWCTILKQTTMKYNKLLLDRYYFTSFCSSPVRMLFTMLSFLVNLFPSPMKINQYLLSFVSVSMFFTSNGKSESSPNCDSALGVPIDTAEAVLTTILVYIIIQPIIYTFASILYPSPLSCFVHRSRNWTPYRRVTGTTGFDNGFWSKVSIVWRRLTAISSVDWFILKSLFNFLFSLQHNLQSFISSLRKVFGDQPMDEKLRLIFEYPLEGKTVPVTKWLHFYDYTDPNTVTEVQEKNEALESWQDEYPSYHQAFLRILEERDMWGRCIFTPIFAYLNAPMQICVSALAREMWWDTLKHYGKFVLMSCGIWVSCMVADLSFAGNFQDFESRMDQQINPTDMIPIIGANPYAPLPTGDRHGSHASSAIRSKLTALKFHSKEQRDFVVAALRTILSDFIDRRNVSSSTSNNNSNNVSSAANSSAGGLQDRNNGYTLMNGNSGGARGINSSGMMLKLDTAKNLLIFERRGFSWFSSESIAPIRLEDIVEVVPGDQADASERAPDLKLTIVVKNPRFVDIEAYERKRRFLKYLSAMTSCRSVIWQLIPGMTGLAIFSVDTASCPIFVFSKELDSMLTDLIIWNAWEVAKERIRKDNSGKKLVSWQVSLFTVYIFFEESRLVQFIVTMVINFVAYCIVFKSHYLSFIIRGFLALMVVSGFVRVGYTVIPLYQFFFP